MDSQILKADCLRCNSITNHTVLAEKEVRASSPDGDIHVGRTYQIVECCGCNEVSFRKESWSSEDVIDQDTGEIESRVDCYPSRTDGRAPTKAFQYMPARVAQIYEETLRALNTNAPILTAIGLRATVEAVCIDKGSAGANLQGKIDGLVTLGALSEMQARFLHEHRFMGNEAAHEIVTPSNRDLLAALDIIETVLQTLYELPVLASGLEDSRRRRRPGGGGP